MTEHSKHLDDTSINKDFDKELHARAQEMREHMQPSSEVINNTIKTAKKAAQENQKKTQGEGAEKNSAQEGSLQDTTFSEGARKKLSAPTGYPFAATPQRPQEHSSQRKGQGRNIFAGFAAAAATVVVLIGGIAVYHSLNSDSLVLSDSSTQSYSSGNSVQDQQESPSSSSEESLTTLGSYDEIYDSLEANAFPSSGEVVLYSEPTPSFAPDPSATPDSTESSNQSETLASPEPALDGGSVHYSETNTQVAGVDEADIVKTDGRYLYILSSNEVIIARADGADTEEVSRISLSLETAIDLYIANGRLVIINENYPYYQDVYGFEGAVSSAAIYDISAPEKPELLGTFGQDGSLNTTRLVEGVLYIVSQQTLWSERCERDKPQTFVPNTYDRLGVDQSDIHEAAKAFEVSDIHIAPNYDSARYTVLTAIDVTSAERRDKITLLGNTDTVYMNEQNLFLTATHYKTHTLSEEAILFEEETKAVSRTQQGEPQIVPWGFIPSLLHFYELALTQADPKPLFDDRASEDAPLSLPEYSAPVTRITRFALQGGSPEATATATVDGVLLNQFSLDEHEGYLRMALTLTKHVSELENYHEAPTTGKRMLNTNSLLILDEQLKVVGSIENMALDERIYSVRFTGSVGYMVTFRETDPLFSLDLSDPAHPRVMDALKIPGFSEYLHPYAEGLLLGIGQDTTDSGIRSGYLKLSMFDVNNPFDIAEHDKELIDAFTSPALQNHKSVLIDENKDLIGFSVEARIAESGSRGSYERGDYYLIYGYSKEHGLYERASIELPEAFEETRALYIDNHLYIVCGKHIGIFDLETLEELVWVTL